MEKTQSENTRFCKELEDLRRVLQALRKGHSATSETESPQLTPGEVMNGNAWTNSFYERSCLSVECMMSMHKREPKT